MIMEEVLNENIATPEVKGMVVNDVMKESLISSTKWAKFLLILQSIGVAIIVLIAIAMFAFGTALASKLGGAAVGSALGAIYLVIAAVLVYPIVKGFAFCSAVRTACENDNEAELLRGFRNMRSWLKFYGILAIVVLVLYALIAIFGIIAAASVTSQF